MSDKILIVDDSRVQTLAMKKMLEKQFPEDEVIIFNSPLDAIEELRSETFHIHFALIDYNMEPMDGLSLITELLKNEGLSLALKNTHLVSANIQEAVKKKTEDLGINFIAKPFDAKKFHDLILQQEAMSA